MSAPVSLLAEATADSQRHKDALEEVLALCDVTDREGTLLDPADVREAIRRTLNPDQDRVDARLARQQPWTLHRWNEDGA